MKERPILMSAPMVRAILEGRKTQTRRVVKPQPSADVDEISETVALDPISAFMTSGHSGLWEDQHNLDERWKCPYGTPGDRLWVKETWAPHRPHLRKKRPRLLKKNEPLNYAASYIYSEDRESLGPWQSPLFMMRHQSRIVLEVTRVRVERLQNMEGQAPYPGESDALAEGIHRIHHGDGYYSYSAFRTEPHPENWTGPIAAYRELWDSLNGDKPAARWSANPWVWVVEFKRV